MSCFFFHKWAKWSAPTDLMRTTYLYGEVVKTKVIGQSRECEKCNKIELREIGAD